MPSLTNVTVARLRHLLPGFGEIDERLRDDDARLVGYLVQEWALRIQLPQRAHVPAVVQRPRPPLARVSKRPHALPIGRGARHLEWVLGAVPVPRILNQPNHPLDRSWRIILKA